MGKIKGIFATNISGRVGNVVFRKNGSENIVSQRPSSVKNPRSDMQQIQRAYIKTVASAYSVLKPLCDHSFEGVSYGAMSMQHFNKKNYVIVKDEEQAVLKNSSDVVVPINLLISSGSINWAGFKNLNSDGILQLGDIKSFLTDNAITDLLKLTAQQFFQILGIQDGDQITVVKLRDKKEIYYRDLTQYGSELVYSRYIINAAGNSGGILQKIEGTFPYYTINPVFLSPESNVRLDCQLIILNDKIFISGDDEIHHDYNGPCTIIISRKRGGSWLRSTASLEVPESYLEGKDRPYDIDKVLPSYGPTGERYLNNAQK